MPNRTVCSVLEEMRKLNDTRNYAALLSYIEEVQGLVNRMEAALWDQNDLTYARKELKELKKEVKELEKQRDILKDANPVSKIEG
jgi:hypothetical protein